MACILFIFFCWSRQTFVPIAILFPRQPSAAVLLRLLAVSGFYESYEKPKFNNKKTGLPLKAGDKYPIFKPGRQKIFWDRVPDQPYEYCFYSYNCPQWNDDTDPQYSFKDAVNFT